MADPIEVYVAALDRRLTGPRRIKRDMLTEARDSLVDAAEAHREAGLDPHTAQRQAIAEFGTAAGIAPAYQLELAAASARRLAVLVIMVPMVAMLFGDRMWQSAPWADTPPPAPYGFLARSLDYATYVFFAAAVLAFAVLRWRARSGADPRRVCRALGIGTLVSLGVTLVLGNSIWIATVLIFPAALTWPPMLVGGALFGAIGAVQLIGAVRCLSATRAAGALTPEPVAYR